MKIQCVAIDDEPLALKQIAGYIKQTPFLELVAECGSAFDAMTAMKDKTIQLLFVDINMPDMSGMDFVKSLTTKPFIVFTTAYSEHAVEGFKVDAVDYLLKPISYSCFLKAANKVKEIIDLKSINASEKIATGTNHLFVKSEYKLIRIEFADIKYIESEHEYVSFHLVSSKPIMALLSIKSLEEQLPTENFMRVHRSFIVNLSKISVIERDRIIFDKNVYIPVSDRYKSKFHDYVDKYFLS